MKTYVWAVLILLSMVSLASCSSAGNTPSSTPSISTPASPKFTLTTSIKMKTVFPQALIELLQQAESVETFRIQDSDNRSEFDLPKITARGKSFGPERAKAFAQLISDEKSYEFDAHKDARPNFGVLWSLKCGKNMVEVYQCFMCGEWWIRGVDENGTLIADFMHANDPARKQLLQWAKEGLPDDKVIQGVE